jgi:hypothetical protein
LFCCGNWTGLADDLADLRAAGLVSLTVVADPLAEADPELLQRHFADLARPYKEHYLVDLAGKADQFGSSHHRRNVARFARRGVIDICADPVTRTAEWTGLYNQLIARHGITGIARFSAASFRRQLALPGLVLLRARTMAGELVGMQLWFCDGDKVWYHLGAYSELGYRLGGASAALTSHALKHFRDAGLRWANLGSGAGVSHDAQDGLSRFKQGWATATRWAWLYGAVLSPGPYREACLAAGVPAHRASATAPDFFPAYRWPRSRMLAATEVVVHAHAD